ncbi:MAG: hypothetical protein WCG27_09445, partial [Pseudomonadota bacterium]
MDEQTLKIYNLKAVEISGQHQQQAPQELYLLMKEYFHQGGKTIDVGAGHGRDVHWANSQGYPT